MLEAARRPQEAGAVYAERRTRHRLLVAFSEVVITVGRLIRAACSASVGGVDLGAGRDEPAIGRRSKSDETIVGDYLGRDQYRE